MALQEYFRVGRILRPQGLSGEVKVQVLSEDLHRFEGMESVFLEGKDAAGKTIYQKRAILKCRTGHDAAYLLLDSAMDRTAAERLRNVYLCVAREELAPLPEGRWYVSDLIGCIVMDETGKEYGEVSDLLQHGAADVYVIRKPGAKGEWMFPSIRSVLLAVDVDEKRITIDSVAFEQVAVFNP